MNIVINDDLSSISTSLDNLKECCLPNYNPETLINAYVEASSYYPPLLHRIARDLPVSPGFDPNGFDISIDYIAETKMVGMAFVPRYNMNFTLGEKEIFLPQGEKYYFATAFKPDILTFQSLATQAGFKVKETLQNETNCVLHILEA